MRRIATVAGLYRRAAWAVVAALLLSTVAVVAPASAAVLTLVDGTHQLKFNRANGVTYFANGTSSGTVTAPAIGATLLYKNVVTVGGLSVDAAVTLTDVASGSISNFDNPGSASTATGYTDFFQLNTVGGRATLRFDFFEAGTWSGANTGVPVILQNVKIKSIDLDSSGTNGFQYSDFSGFQKYTMTTDTNLGVQAVAGTNLVRFIATKTGARSAVPQDQVLVKYDALSTMTISFGNVTPAQTNYFGLTFGPWAEGGTTQEYSNGFNAAPTSTDTTQRVESATATVIPKSSFGNYQDVDANPFMQIKITALEVSGDLEAFVGGSWTDVALGQVISVADIERGYLRFTGTQNDTVKFLVHDGLDYSATDYTLTLTIVNEGQYIDFANPGAKVVGTAFPAGAVSKKRSDNALTNLGVTLTSQTSGICTTTGDTITAVAAGTCIIVATQPGDGTYGAATPVTQTFPITATLLTAQSIGLSNPGSKDTGASPFAANETSTSGLPVTLTSLTPNVCTVSGSTITIVGPGTCTIRATQPGNGTYAPAIPVEVSFLVAAGAPIATTTAATGVSSTSATLNGSINGFGSSTTVTFCVSTANTVNGSGALNCDVSTETAAQSPVLTSGTKLVSKTKSSGLTANATYYYQVIANNGQTTYGNVVSFKASDPGASGAVTKPVTTQSSAGNSKYDVTLPGTVTTSSGWTANFCYKTSSSAPSTSNGRISSCKVTSPSTSISSSSAQAVSKTVQFSDSDVVWYQVVATNGTETSTGRVLRFQVRGPYAQTDAATSIGNTTARMNGMVDRQGKDLDSVKFCLTSTKPTDLDTNPILTCKQSNTASGWSKSTSGNQSVYYNLTGLSEGTTYYFQVTAKTSRGTNYGQILEFTTTKPAPAPVVKTEPATAVNATTATLNGAVDPHDFDATATFCYGTSNTLSGCTSVGASPTSVSGNANVPVSAELSGLTSGQTYFFRVLATNANGSDTGTILSFTPGAPIAITSAAINGSTTMARLNGAARAQGDTATVSFCWGTSNTVTDGVLGGSCATVVAAPSTVSGTTLSPVTADVESLTVGTTYYFQTIAEKNGKRAYGDVKSFVAATGPDAVTDTATAGPRLNGRVTANGDLTNVYFCYGQNSATRDGLLLGCTLTVADTPTVAATASLLARTLDLSTVALASGATYYFQIVAENSRGTVYGNVRSFTAASTGPAAETGDADLVNSLVTLHGVANANGQDSTVKFCYRNAYSVDSTTVPGVDILTGCTATSATAPSIMVSGSSSTIKGTLDVDETVTVSGLTPGTTYYYQLKAWTTATPSQVAYGAIKSFTYGAPRAVTVAATDITSTGAIVHGNVSGDTITATSFCIGTTSTVDPFTGAMDACFGAADTVTVVAASALTGDVSETETTLTAGTTYYFQVLATNARGTTYGAVMSFIAGRATVITDPVSGLSSTAATLNGSVNPNGANNLPMTYRMSFTDAVDGAGLLSEPLVDIDTDSATGTAALSRPLPIVDLLASTKYYYQLVGDLAGTPVVGGVEFFITDPLLDTESPNVGSTDVWFYGQTSEDLVDVMFCWATKDNARTDFDPTTCTSTPASGSSSQYSAYVTGLTSGTNYQVQIFGKRGGNWFRGAIVNFTTSGSGAATPNPTTARTLPAAALKKLSTPTKVLPKKGTKTDTSVTTTEKKATEAKLQPVVQKVVAPPAGGTTTPTVKLENVTVLPEIKEQVAKQIKLEETSDGVKVTPVDGFTGKLVVPVITVANNEEVEVLTEVIVNPEPAPDGQSTPASLKKTKLEWEPSSSQVVEYVVELNGKEVCKTVSTSCEVSALVGPKTNVEVTAIGNDQTESTQTDLKYKALQFIAAAKVQFDESSSKLKPTAKKILQEVAKVIIEAGFTSVAIEGHTDSQGGQKNASPLSKARAVATQKYLDSLLPERLDVKLKGSGLSKPVASNTTAAGQAKNRRAEVLVK